MNGYAHGMDYWYWSLDVFEYPASVSNPMVEFEGRMVETAIESADRATDIAKCKKIRFRHTLGQIELGVSE